MSVAYATSDELASYLGTAAPSGADRLLARATELIDGIVCAWFAVDDATGLPSDADVAATLRDAVCAVVEQWLEVGESNDVDGLAGSQVGIGTYTGRRAPQIPPRAVRILKRRGLL